MGKLEIIMSPGFVNQGIISCEGDQVANLLRKGLKIGVSSRGVGSLQKEDGKNIVQDDFLPSIKFHIFLSPYKFNWVKFIIFFS